ncbi:MAG: hypothetical protein MUD14_24390 [Hydrococcus sp. Prado102]|nr:hypothetical protein [Hydrococcus sp. Prado102]
MRGLLVPLLAVALASAAPVGAQDTDMTVAQYLADWNRIDATEIRKEVEATGTFDPAKYPDFARAISLMRTVALAYRDRIKQERAAGQAPHSCLPDGETEITSDVLIAHLRSYAPSQQGADSG